MASPPWIISHISNLLLLVICVVTVFDRWPNTVAAANFSSKNNPFHNDITSLTIASSDYGNIVHNKPSLVLDPTSVDDILNFVRQSPPNAKISVRGHGHSLRGQDMALGGVVVNMTALAQTRNRIVIGRNLSYVDVGAEQLWVDVLRSTLKRGYAPVSWTDYLYLTVGGTLSNAGYSGQSFLHGPQITNVHLLDLVTGKGQLITCSRRLNPELFFGALGGLGQFGIITKARIVLNKAPTTAKWAKLIYTDFSTFTKDQEHLISSNSAGGASYVEGFLIVNMSSIDQWRSPGFPISNTSLSRMATLLQENRILYYIELAKYYDNNQQSDDFIDKDFNMLLQSLNFIEGLNFTRQVSYFDFLHRVGNLDTPEMGSLLSHPWLVLFLPKSEILDFNKRILVGMLPRLSSTPSPFLFYPLNKNKWDDAMSAVTPDLTPADNGVFYTLGLLHSAPQDKYQTIENFNTELLDVCRKFGIKVKQYLPYYNNNTSGWEDQFGSKWGRFQARKQMFDPNHKLSPGQGIFN